MSSPAGIEDLRDAVAAGDARTVRVCFPDHYGVLRGRRIVADVFAADPEARQGFCDGALVWDIRCDIFEATDFSNFGTGYPDLYVRPELDTLRPCAWTGGEWSAFGDCRDDAGNAIDVDPRGLLRAIDRRAGSPPITARLELHLSGSAADPVVAGVVEAARGIGVGLAAIEHSSADGILTIGTEPLPALAAADALVTLRTAARELASIHGAELTAMSQTGEGRRATRLLVGVLDGEGRPSPQPSIEEFSLLLRPLPGGARGVEAGDATCAAASSDANPYLVIAAAVAAAADSGIETVADGGSDDPYRASIERFAGSPVVREWLPPLFIHDAVALARREAEISENGSGPWDPDRYRECG